MRFHGVNMVCKSYRNGYIPTTDRFNVNTSLATQDWQSMQELGMNFLRLGSMWPGVNPRRGVVNTSYLQQLREIVIAGAEYGVHTLLDMHQDVGSRRVCGIMSFGGTTLSFAGSGVARLPGFTDIETFNGASPVASGSLH